MSIATLRNIYLFKYKHYEWTIQNIANHRQDVTETKANNITQMTQLAF